MKIITVSREFGSGGRELGKRVAEYLGFDYYDREIVTEIAQRCDVSEGYAKYLLRHQFTSGVSITVRQSFSMPSVLQTAQLQVLRAQTSVIEDVAKVGRDFLIVGRNADILLAEYHPFNIFVCSDQESKIKRCMERAQPGEKLTEKEILQNGKVIDKNRRKTREMISDSAWGSREGYHLIVNTAGWEIKNLVPYVAAYADGWFKEMQKETEQKAEPVTE